MNQPSPRQNINVINPFTQEVDRSYLQDSFLEAQEKVLASTEVQKLWRKQPLKERVALITKALSYFEENKDLIAEDIAKQMGRPSHQALGEIGGFFERANYLCSIAEETLAPDVFDDKPGFDRSICHSPHGVIFVIAAWNFPLLITVNSVVPALLAGNTVLLKHSSQTPETGLHFERAFGTLGPFKNLLQNLIIDHKTTEEIITQLPIDHVIFTGSVTGGRRIANQCANNKANRFINPALELGGKDGAYVAEDAELKATVDTVVDGAMFNSGQSCCGIERVYVHESIYENFIEEAKKLIDHYQLGDPMDKNSSQGPLSSSGASAPMRKQVEQAVSMGAKVICGGKEKIIEKGVFFEPTLIVDVNHQMDIVSEENFGPIMAVMKVQGLNEAIAKINDSQYGLTASIFTTDITKAKEFAAEVEVGTVFMNRCDYLDPALPWTGVKNSGCGSSLSKYGFYSVTRRTSHHFKLPTNNPTDSQTDNLQKGSK